MKYSDYFGKLDRDSLAALAEKYNIPYENAVSLKSGGNQEIVEALVRYFTDKDFLDNLINSLSDVEYEILLIIYSSSERISTDNVLRKLNANRGKGTANRALLDELVRKGVLILEEVTYNRIVCRLPKELEKRLLFRMLEDSGCLEIETEALPYPSRLAVHLAGDGREGKIHTSSFTEFIVDMETLLAFYHREKPKLTQKGKIYKKAVERMQMYLRTASPTETAIADEYPPTFDLLDKILRILDLTVCRLSDSGRKISAAADGAIGGRDYGVESYESHMEVDEERVLRWLGLPEESKLQIVSDVIRKVLLLRYEYRKEVLEKLTDAFTISDGSINYTSFLGTMAKYSSGNHSQFYLNSYATLIDFFEMLGFLECEIEQDSLRISLNDYGRTFFNLESAIPKHENEKWFYLQPDFEILAPIRLDPLIRWKLGKLAELVKIDNMMFYMLTRDSAQQGRKLGLTTCEILDFLKEYSRTGVPQNVEYSVKEWAESYDNLIFSEVALLTCKSEDVAEEILSYEDVSGFIVEKISKKHFIVDKTKLGDFSDFLRKRGYQPVLDMEEKTNCDEESRTRITDENFQIVNPPLRGIITPPSYLKVLSIPADPSKITATRKRKQRDDSEPINRG